MEVYFDNSATTRCYDSVKDIVVKTMTEDFGNPSAMHLKGVEAEKYVKEATKTIAGILKVQEKEILFTSGGTESDNLALIGGALANKRNGNHIIITSVEHAAVSQPALYLQEQGFEITYLPVDAQGRVKMSALEAVLRPDTIMVSTMLVNNEVGAVMPVEEIAKMVHEKSPKALYHVDAIQGFGKYHIYPKRMGIDLLAVSGHKIHGPKGVGFLYINEKVKIIPQILGGGQQSGMRSGTDNVPGIAGMALAASMCYDHLEEKVEIVTGDIKEAGSRFALASFDVVTSNPPYMNDAHGIKNPGDAKAIARHEVLCTLDDVVREGTRVLKPGGRFYMVHRPRRLIEILQTMKQHGLEPKRMKFVHPYKDREANMVLIEAVRGGGALMKVEAPVIVFDENGEYSQEIRTTYGY